jgi:hypothetical protein
MRKGIVWSLLPGVVDLVHFTLVTEDSDQSKRLINDDGSSALVRWSLEAHVHKYFLIVINNVSDMERRLALAAVVVVRCSNNLNVTFLLYFRCFVYFLWTIKDPNCCCEKKINKASTISRWSFTWGWSYFAVKSLHEALFYMA